MMMSHSYDIDLESQVIAALINDEACLVEGMATVKKEYFTDSFYRAVFDHLKNMYHSNKHIDSITAYEELKDVAQGRGVNWLVLKDAFFDKRTFGYCVEKLSTLYLSRRLCELAQEAVSSIENGNDILDIIASHESQLYVILMKNDNAVDIITPKEQAEQMLDTLMGRVAKKSNGGIRTGYKKLNFAVNGGFLPGQLVILAAQTGKGKTAFAMNLMRDIAIFQKNTITLYKHRNVKRTDGLPLAVDFNTKRGNNT